MNRTPPVAVLRELRNEVGFACPVQACNSPFLEWHHFDPPWREENHHNPKGMIALCREHHIQADVGAFTTEQLLEMKSKHNDSLASAKFNWLRNKILLVLGGSYFYDFNVALQYGGRPIVWFERDENNNLLLNFDMLSTSREKRACMRKNQWYSSGLEEDIVCPPSGRKVQIRYDNGDFISIEFLEKTNSFDLFTKFPRASPDIRNLTYPVTCVVINGAVGGTEVRFSPEELVIPGNNSFAECFFKGGNIAISF